MVTGIDCIDLCLSLAASPHKVQLGLTVIGPIQDHDHLAGVITDQPGQDGIPCKLKAP
jgi:hypothetical protein